MKSPLFTSLFTLLSFCSFAQNASLDWVRTSGGSSNDHLWEITTDPDGNIYSIGKFMDTVDFNPDSIAVFNLISSGGDDVFIQKLDSNGNFIWAKSFGGTDDDVGQSIVADEFGNLYTTGWFSGDADFDPGTSTLNLKSNGSSDAFVQKLDSQGNLIWARSFGGVETDRSFEIELDQNNNVYTTGYFDSLVDFNPNAGTFNLKALGFRDMFLQKLDSNGIFVWAKSTGGLEQVIGRSLYYDGGEHLYIAGYFEGQVDFNPNAGATILHSDGEDDAFIQKLDTNGDFSWAYSIEGENNVRAWSITGDGSDNILVSGFYFDTADFDHSTDTFDLISNGINDLFVLKVTKDGDFVWAKSVGGPRNETAYAVLCDPFDNVYCTGIFRDTVDFDPGEDSTFMIANGNNDAYILKLDKDGNYLWSKSFGSPNSDQGQAMLVDNRNRVYLAGFFQDTVDFDPNQGTKEAISQGASDFYIMRLTQKITGNVTQQAMATVQIFPNPNYGIVNVNLGGLENAVISCFDLSGKLVYQRKFINSSTIQFSLENIPGIYIVQIESNGVKVHKRLVKM